MMGTYLLDSNIYINFYDRYYKSNIFPSFWNSMIPILNDKVVIPDIVINENVQDSWFRNWIGENYSESILRHNSYAQKWAEVIKHVNGSPFYTDLALNSDKGWAKEWIADPWIIAIALEEGLTIVTDERKNVNLSDRNPSRSVKIPDICQDLNLRCINMNEFFEEIQFIL